MTVSCEATLRRIVAGPWSQNCYIVSAGDDAVLVDPGGRPKRIVEQVAADRLRVHAVLVTHGHYDHVGALPETTMALGAPFAMHADDVRTLGRVNLYRYALHRWDPIEIPEIGLDLASAPHLTFGELRIGVLHTPGHTPGSVCFEVGGALLTGDTLTTSPAEDAETREVDPAALRASVRRLAGNYTAETVIHPGHGEPGSLGAAVASLGLGASPG